MTSLTNPGATSRDRLLEAAADLFYREGVHVGVDALCRAAGVSKRSMYQLFDSKDAVIAESLDRMGPGHSTALLPAADDDRPAREWILHVFRRLEELSMAGGYRGCPFVATAVEVKSPDHPAAEVARRYKQNLTAFFRAQAERGAAPDPELLARQLTVAFDGSSAWAVVRAQPLDGLAVATAESLLAAAGMD
jgi:AcrR family transcriptional regulator